jgi:hypothetical protein
VQGREGAERVVEPGLQATWAAVTVDCWGFAKLAGWQTALCWSCGPRRPPSSRYPAQLAGWRASAAACQCLLLGPQLLLLRPCNNRPHPDTAHGCTAADTR